jgi:hypothetical protein
MLVQATMLQEMQKPSRRTLAPLLLAAPAAAQPHSLLHPNSNTLAATRLATAWP